MYGLLGMVLFGVENLSKDVIKRLKHSNGIVYCDFILKLKGILEGFEVVKRKVPQCWYLHIGIKCK